MKNNAYKKTYRELTCVDEILFTSTKSFQIHRCLRTYEDHSISFRFQIRYTI